MTMKLALDIVRQQIANLLLVHPELKEDEEAWALSLESETEALDLFRQIEQRRQSAAHLAGAIASNIAELQLRQERFVQRERAMRSLMFKLMEQASLKRIELPEATVTIRAGSPQVVILDHRDLPDELCRIKREADKSAVREALNNGAELKGAYLSNGIPSLSIRTK